MIYGYVQSIKDAKFVIDCVKKNKFKLTLERLKKTDVVESGDIFVFDEEKSNIKRWTDNLRWSPSRIDGEFLVYRECGWIDRKKRKSYGDLKLEEFGEGGIVSNAHGSYYIIDDGLLKRTICMLNSTEIKEVEPKKRNQNTNKLNKKDYARAKRRKCNISPNIQQEKLSLRNFSDEIEENSELSSIESSSSEGEERGSEREERILYSDESMITSDLEKQLLQKQRTVSRRPQRFKTTESHHKDTTDISNISANQKKKIKNTLVAGLKNTKNVNKDQWANDEYFENTTSNLIEEEAYNMVKKLPTSEVNNDSKKNYTKKMPWELSDGEEEDEQNFTEEEEDYTVEEKFLIYEEKKKDIPAFDGSEYTMNLPINSVESNSKRKFCFLNEGETENFDNNFFSENKYYSKKPKVNSYTTTIQNEVNEMNSKSQFDLINDNHLSTLNNFEEDLEIANTTLNKLGDVGSLLNNDKCKTLEVCALERVDRKVGDSGLYESDGGFIKENSITEKDFKENNVSKTLDNEKSSCIAEAASMVEEKLYTEGKNVTNIHKPQMELSTTSEGVSGTDYAPEEKRNYDNSKKNYIKNEKKNLQQILPQKETVSNININKNEFLTNIEKKSEKAKVANDNFNIERLIQIQKKKGVGIESYCPEEKIETNSSCREEMYNNYSNYIKEKDSKVYSSNCSPEEVEIWLEALKALGNVSSSCC
ncbi:hypothetical protein HDU92_005329 [Lobulomyces angularis]|nr:hypothetical protein HDU92_005329 [Lobulomyces angularis]